MEEKMGRRAFLKDAAIAAAGVSILRADTVFGTQANSAVRMGLIGCGGRGTGVAASFAENTSAQYVAMADIFKDRLAKSAAAVNKALAAKGAAPIPDANLLAGSKAYLRLLERKDVDAVQISSPPFLHPDHLDAAIESGKHVYCEKPVAVDVHGCQRVIWTGRKAGGRLSLAVGFQIRHATPFVGMVRRIHEGQIGDLVTVQACYLAGAVTPDPYPGASPVELRLRHWIHDRVLSGDILVEQGIHVVDICNWVTKAHPVSAVGCGGRAGRKDGGDCWSNYLVRFTYPNDLHVSFQSTQFDPGLQDVFQRFFGTKGIAESHYVGGVFIKGANPWDSGVARGSREEISSKQWAVGAFKSSLEDADPNKQKAFIESITSGKLLNEAETGAESALSAILGRTAAYSGEEVTWSELLASGERWDPMIDLTQFDK